MPKEAKDTAEWFEKLQEYTDNLLDSMTELYDYI
jgi:hypothetical protein